MTEPTNLRFAKYEGLGNDFLIVDATDEALLGAAQVAKLCDRHFGVGAMACCSFCHPRRSERAPRWSC
ncbi:MAG: hypothetical protein WDO74_33970 [Pseudomonadota bacterium]